MRRKLKIIGIVSIIIWIATIFVSFNIFLLIGLIGLLLVLFGLCFIVANKLVKRTNAWKNIFIHTKQFVLNIEYRSDLQRNYDIVNLGSNPALFAFFYENIKGQNWATGSQGPEMDLAILKSYHSYIKKGGVVLIPIVAFSSCTAYLWKYKPSYNGMNYYAKFAKILSDGNAADSVVPNAKKVRRWLRFPLLCNLRFLAKLFMDSPMDTRHLQTEQSMQLLELNNDADKWIKGWKEEFDIKDLEAPLSEIMDKMHEETSRQFADIVDFCRERDLRPILIYPPMSKVLLDRFTPEVRERYVYSFVRRIQQKSDVQFLDYTTMDEFLDPSLYFNSFFLNMRGRKLFTRRVLKDIGLIR